MKDLAVGLVLALMADSVLVPTGALAVQLNPTSVVLGLMIRKIHVLRHFTGAGTAAVVVVAAVTAVVVGTEVAVTGAADTAAADTEVVEAGLDQADTEVPIPVIGVVGVAAELAETGAGMAGATPGDGMDP
jgi:hypothetical protein